MLPSAAECPLQWLQAIFSVSLPSFRPSHPPSTLWGQLWMFSSLMALDMASHSKDSIPSTLFNIQHFWLSAPHSSTHSRQHWHRSELLSSPRRLLRLLKKKRLLRSPVLLSVRSPSENTLTLYRLFLPLHSEMPTLSSQLGLFRPHSLSLSKPSSRLSHCFIILVTHSFVSRIQSCHRLFSLWSTAKCLRFFKR